MEAVRRRRIMDSARYHQIQTRFQQAAELSPAYQDAFLKAECDDQDLISEVRAMLDEDARSASLLDRDVAEIADEVFGKPIASPDARKEIGSYQVTRCVGD